MLSDDERSKRLDGFAKILDKDLDETTRRMDQKLKQWADDEFDYHMTKAEQYAKNGDEDKALEHELLARLLNSKLKDWKTT
jgi:hypothetical protein